MRVPFPAASIATATGRSVPSPARPRPAAVMSCSIMAPVYPRASRLQSRRGAARLQFVFQKIAKDG
ncbi:hypothetical protein LNKW23_06060 [Paralimibaculum aggregatum]|uniref:Uncharacterized protein n=1 Tax=Paralimibaculum aggregatum TaxID=3036245 RepID=A0ABQ6LDF2_9RHOB|nr:hypothetical protein LNKW23_06060 [Limibaculum sp. NKW23]